MRQDPDVDFNPDTGTVAQSDKILDEATVTLRDAARLKPKSFETHFALGHVILARGKQLDEAVAAFCQAALQPRLCAGAAWQAR